MARPHKVVLREKDLRTPDEAHALLSEELDFPEFYGANWDALADCLGDVCDPTRIVLKRADEGARKEWFDVLVRVVSECAQRSCYVGCSIR